MPLNLFELAVNYYKTGEIEKTEDICREIVQKYPSNTNALYLLGKVKGVKGEIRRSEQLINRAIEIEPKDYYYCELGLVYKAKGELKEAVDAFNRAISINPKNATAHTNLGIMYFKLQIPDKAAMAFQRAVNIDRDNPITNYLLAALTGDTPESPPQAYIISLFNQYAKNFDRQLVHILEYRVPFLLYKAFLSICGKHSFKNAIDLGCGTGLAGREFRRKAKKITGVDLAINMVEKARTKRIYDELYVGDMTVFLDRAAETYDLFIATDVLGYLGNLFPLFDAIKKSAKPEAYILFSTESTEDADYKLLQVARYAHSANYIASLACQFLFEIKLCETINLRKEKGKWVEGNIFILKA